MAVKFQLYAANGTTPVYLFPVVFSANYPHTEKDLIQHNNIRGKGSIIVEGGEVSWDLTLKGVFNAEDYDALMTLVDAMESAIVLNTPYVLKITKKDGVTTQYTYNVKRITQINTQEDSLRTNFIEYQLIFRVNSW
jgi:hypothetical protein